MIRYVLVAVLAVALLALSIPAVNYAATENTDRQVVSEIDSIETAAESLIANEEIPPDGQQRPLRTLEISLPGDSLTTQSVDTFEIERLTATSSRVTYTVEGRSQQQAVIDAPIVYENPYENRTVEVGGSGDTELELYLEEDQHGVPVVVATREGQLEGGEEGRTFEPPEPASFDVTIVDTNAPVGEGDAVTVDVDVTNSGDIGDTQTVDLEIDGLGSDADDVELGPDESATVTLGVDTDDGYWSTDPGEQVCTEEFVIPIPIIGDITVCLEYEWVGGSSEWIPGDDVGSYEATVTSDNTIAETDVTVHESPS